MPFELTPESYRNFSDQVIKAEGDQATLTTLLADMQETFTQAIASDNAARERVATIEAENKRLLEANMKLFLRTGEEASSQSQPKAKEEEKPQSVSGYLESYFEEVDKEKK